MSLQHDANCTLEEKQHVRPHVRFYVSQVPLPSKTGFDRQCKTGWQVGEKSVGLGKNKIGFYMLTKTSLHGKTEHI